MNASFFLNSKWLRRLAGAVVAVLLVWGIGWLVLPSWLKTQLETRLGDQLGRRVTVGQVEFKPWSLELTLHDFAVAQATGTAPQAEVLPQLFVKRLYIDAELQSLIKLAPVVDAITLESPQLRLTHLGQPPALLGDDWTAFVFVFHDRDWEDALLPSVLTQPAFLIGAVGSRRTHAQRLERLAAAGVIADQTARIKGPFGLIPATRDPASLALSILAEVAGAYPAPWVRAG